MGYKELELFFSLRRAQALFEVFGIKLTINAATP
jgi:hypothetical protein